jgi:pyruvate/2-oxoglutarate/acetoin dehydrogenase E1 component
MAVINYVEAINQAFKEEMRRDDRVVMWGEDLISLNGVQGQTRGIYDEFGGDRIKDTPICELAITGMTVGAAQRGLRPIGVFMNWGFGLCAFDGIFLRLGCQGRNWPVVLYGVVAGPNEDNDHGMSPEALLIHAPYLKVVLPSTPYDAKGLLKSAIRDDGPVMFLDNGMNFYVGHKEGALKGGANVSDVPEKEYLIPLGKADIKRAGSDITLVTYSFMVHHALAAAYNLEKEGISVEVVDLRSLVPLDVATIVQSVKKTRRLLVVHEAMKRGGVAGEIICRVNEEAPDVMSSLKTPFRRLAAMNLPLSPVTGRFTVPNFQTIAATVKEMVK